MVDSKTKLYGTYTQLKEAFDTGTSGELIENTWRGLVAGELTDEEVTRCIEMVRENSERMKITV